ncbi:MAG: hypothetical protein IPH77_14620 [Ignavibacteria bacterium]|nr:hypothetical protein [Ignavibacteria bacterium]
MNQVNADSVYKFERQLTGDTSCTIGGSAYTIVSDIIDTKQASKHHNIFLRKIQELES